jgi:hypothetical protein
VKITTPTRILMARFKKAWRQLYCIFTYLYLRLLVSHHRHILSMKQAFCIKEHKDIRISENKVLKQKLEKNT